MLNDTTKNLFISIARTAAPLLATLLITWLTGIGINLPVENQAQVSFLIFGLLTLVYYAAAAALERYVSPKFGWLLGVAKTPDYAQTLTDNTNIQPAANPNPQDVGRAG